MDGEWAKNTTITKRSNGTKQKLKQLIVEAIDERISEKTALLFSGGIDSSLLAILLKNKTELTCYCAGTTDSYDWEQSQKNAEVLGVELKRIAFDLEDVRKELPKIAKAIGDTNVMKLGVALPLWFCVKNTKEKNVFFGMGTEELFAGYERHRRLLPDYEAINNECWKGVEGAWERDISRDIGVCTAFNKEPFFPYLDQKVVEEAMAIPAQQKISEEGNKLVLREIAVELGLPKEIAFAPKKAAQYGSRSDKLIRKLAKEQGMRVDSFLSTLL